MNKNLFRFSGIIKNSFVVFAALALVVGGFFAPQQAFAAATVTPATNGANVSIDTTPAGGSGTYTELSGPGITEQVAGDIAVGTHTITLPLGWEFDNSTITIFKIGNVGLASTNITHGLTSFSFEVTSISTSPSILGFSNLKVRPTGTTPSTGIMTHSGAGIAGVTDGSTSFGTLSTVAGTVTKLAFTIQPGGAVYGSVLNPQPVVKTQDQFGNDSTKNLAASLEVGLSLTSGTGALVGDATLDIGTGAGNGTVTFTDLYIDTVGVGKQLTASAAGLTPAVSSFFEVTPKTLTATVTANSKTYDGNNTAVITAADVSAGLVYGDVVTADISVASATFSDANAAPGKTVTATGITLVGTKATNYSFNGTGTGIANINKKPITVTANPGQNKVYGEANPTTFAYTPSESLIEGNSFTGALSRASGENVGAYAISQGNLSAGDNYDIAFVANDFNITKKPLTVTALGISREYNQTTDATVTLSSVDEKSGDNLGYAYTSAVFLDKTAANGKQVDVSGISISGSKAGNYNLLNNTAITTANIIKKTITATLNLNNKTYDGDTSAAYSSGIHVVLNGVISGDTVTPSDGTSKAFSDKHVGVNKTVTTIGITLSGVDKDNYEFNGTGTGTATINARPITITAVTDSRIYNGTDVSTLAPAITSGALQGSDTAGFTQKFNNKNVGTGKTLTPSGSVNDGNLGANYTVTLTSVSTGVITQKSINVTAQPDTKVYDGAPTSSKVPVVDVLETGDTVGTPPIQSYGTKDVGINKTLIASDLVINDSFGGANYNVTYVNNTAGVINAKGLIVTGATTNSKIYNGNENATVNFGLATLVGKIGAEDVTLNSTGYSATFNNKNVSIGKTVTVAGLSLSGTGAGNYSLTQPVLTDGVISVETLTVTAVGINKLYNANTTATVTLGDNRVPGDNVTLGYTATFADKIVGNSKAVSVFGISITGGADAGNYTLGNTTAATTADITPATLTATITVANKVFYDGNTSATITGRTLVGVLGTDVVTPNADGIATFADATVGNNKVVTATGITINGADVGNYSYGGTATGTGNILPIPTIVYIDDNWVGTTLGVDPDDTGPATAFGYDAFATIQDGISKVAVGGTINVAAGSYTEGLTINKSLTLQGAGLSLVTVTGNQTVTASSTLDGFTFSGTVTIDDSSAVVSGGTISNNVITGSGGNGIRLGSGVGQGIDHITIRNNQITGNSGKGIAFYNAASYAAQHISYITIDNNQITNNNNSGISTYGPGPNTITNNTVSGNNGNGISIKYDNGDVVSGNIVTGNAAMGINMHQVTNTIVENNTVSGQVSDGVVTNFWGGSIAAGKGSAIYIHENSNGNTIHLNTLINNKIGVLINREVAGDDPANNSINNNTIAGNTVYGVLNALVSLASPADATRNWWGNASGPYHSTNPSGTGNAVSNNITFRPWYLSLADLNGSILDQSAPIPTITSSKTSPTNASPIPFTVNFDESVSGFEVGDITVGNGTAGSFLGSGSSYTFSVTPDNGYQGTITVNIGAEKTWDVSGNYNTAATQYSITFDSVAPTAEIIAGTPASLTNSTSADITIGGTDVIAYKYKLDADSYSVSETLIATHITLSGLADGEHKLYIIGRDAAGNWQTEPGTATLTWTIDNTAPVVAITAPADGARVNGNAVIYFTDNSSTTPKCFINALEEVSCISGVTTLSDLTGFGSLGNISFTLSLKDTDPAGNEGATSVNLIKDITPPTILSHIPILNAVSIYPAANITITFNEAVEASLSNISFSPSFSSFTASGSGTSIITITPTVPLTDNTVYTITVSGITDLAGNPISSYHWSFTTATNYAISLYSNAGGWNLISLPVVPISTNISSVLGGASSSINAVWTYDPSNPNADSGWLVYVPGDPPRTNNLDVMTTGYGYWISATANASLTGSGTLLKSGPTAPPSRELNSGWNLIGYYQIPGESTSTPAVAFSSLGGSYTGLWGFNNVSGNFKSVTGILPGDAFWISLPSSKVYTPSN